MLWEKLEKKSTCLHSFQRELPFRVLVQRILLCWHLLSLRLLSSVLSWNLVGAKYIILVMTDVVPPTPDFSKIISCWLLLRTKYSYLHFFFFFSVAEQALVQFAQHEEMSMGAKLKEWEDSKDQMHELSNYTWPKLEVWLLTHGLLNSFWQLIFSGSVKCFTSITKQ